MHLPRPFAGALAALLWLLAGCASTERYERSLDRLVGLHEAELVQQLGRPARSYAAGGFRYLVYESRDTAYMPGTSNNYDTEGRGLNTHRVAVAGTADLALPVACTTTFELQDDKVIAWAHKGNYCKAGR